MLQKRSVILLTLEIEKEPTLYMTWTPESAACAVVSNCFKSDNIQEY